MNSQPTEEAKDKKEPEFDTSKLPFFEAKDLSFEEKLKLVQMNFRQQAEVYIHACSNCLKHGQALHMVACLFCGSPNKFFDQDLQIHESVVDAVICELMQLYPSKPN